MLHRTVSSNRVFPKFPRYATTPQPYPQYLQLESVRARLRRNERRFVLVVVHGIHALFPAYSLYGALKGNDDNGCTRGNYIHSFFTNYCVDAFEPVMEAAGTFSEDDEDSYSAECQDGDADADADGNDADGGGYGGGTSYANKGDNMGSSSYGMSCY
jgi:hypothetical protein